MRRCSFAPAGTLNLVAAKRRFPVRGSRIEQGGRGHPEDPARPGRGMEDEPVVARRPLTRCAGGQLRDEPALDKLAVEPDIRKATQQSVAGVGLGREEHLLADSKA